MEGEELFTGWGQMLEWVAAMRRDQEEGLLDQEEGLWDQEEGLWDLEALQVLAARQTCALGQLGLAPAPRDQLACGLLCWNKDAAEQNLVGWSGCSGGTGWESCQSPFGTF